MSFHWQFTLSVVPLALYLCLLAAWHSGRHPRVILGPVDFAFLTFAVGGFAIFGPLGHSLMKVVFGRPSALRWMTLASGMLLVAILLSRRAWRRLVLYQIDSETLDRALREILEVGSGPFVRTLGGFEDPRSARGIVVESPRGWRAATIEAFGRDPERLIAELEPRLRRRFDAVEVPRSRLSGWFLGGSILTLIVPLAGWLIAGTKAREALRILLEHLPRS